MILITGATGFLGSELARQLAVQGNSLRCIKRRTSVLPALLEPFAAQIEWQDADLLDLGSLEEAFRDVRLVYHCAAFVSLHQADKERMIHTNVGGTANVVNLCLDFGCRLVHTSSVAAIGAAKPGQLITEEDHLDPVLEKDGYAISKLESEMEVWRGIAEGLEAVIVNPSIIIGAAAETRGSGQLFDAVRRGLAFYTNGGMGFVDVADVARCMILLMGSDLNSERFIVNAENRSYRQILSEIAVCMGRKPPFLVADPWMMELAWRWSALTAGMLGKEPALDKVAARSSVITRAFDNSRIIKATGIAFRPLSDSIRAVCAAMTSGRQAAAVHDLPRNA